MSLSKKLPQTIDEYIKIFPKNVQSILKKMRQTIQKVVPQAVEAMSYQMPTFKLNGKNLVHFAAWKNHIGFYPTPSGTKELLPYKVSKGSARFSLDKPIPYDLIRKIVIFRMKESLKKNNFKRTII